ncbi:MAG: hypothetical protein K9G62_02650 [Alphaproteobacteria bacterium]|nr:hypothetical protein [Alphaproteobacteria bacterium]
MRPILNRVLKGFFAGIAMVMLAMPAFAKDPEVSFHPVKPWILSSVPKTIDGRQVQECTFTNEFDNGFIMSFRGSHKWVQVLAVDFRQDALESGKAYSVFVTVPGLSTKEIPAKAVSKNQIVLDMSAQKDLFKDMRESSVMDLGIASNNFRFYMVGFNGQAKAFEDCMASSTPVVVEKHESPVSVKAEATVNEAVAMEQRALDKTEPVRPVVKPPVPVVSKADAKEIIPLPAVPPQGTSVDRMAASAGRGAPVVPDKIANRRLSEVLAAEIYQNPKIAASESMDRAALQASAAAQVSALRPKAPDAQKENVPSKEIAEEVSSPVASMEIPQAKKTAFLTPDLVPATPVVSEPVTAGVTSPLVQQKPAPAVSSAPVQPVSAQPVIPLPAPASKAPAPLPQIPPRAEVKIHKQTMKMEADLTSLGNPEPAAPFSGMASRGGDRSPENVELLRKTTDLENKIVLLEKENSSLNEELKAILKESKEEVKGISSENWNLERATMRYNESERQLKKMGQQIQQERAECEMEKRDLEAMLFDPKVTEQKQLARLGELERKVAEYEEELKVLRSR